jgi:hypothetical protein
MQLSHTSVPLWAVPSPERLAGSATTFADSTGTSYLLVGVGAAARPVLDAWASDLAAGAYAADVLALHADEPAAAGEALGEALGRAQVGVRVRLAGPVSVCLALRGTAVSAGLEDDELHVRPTEADGLDVFCTHCRHVTTAAAAIGDVVACGGCDRDLVLYHHVSRRSGQVLGYMVDAEEQQVGA